MFIYIYLYFTYQIKYFILYYFIMVRKTKRFANSNNIQAGTRGGDHGRLPLPIVSRGGGRSRRTKRMVRSGTRIRPGITSGGGRSRRTKRMVRSGTRIRPGITA
jgi:hypothetical protein